MFACVFLCERPFVRGCSCFLSWRVLDCVCVCTKVCMCVFAYVCSILCVCVPCDNVSAFVRACVSRDRLIFRVFACACEGMRGEGRKNKCG